MKAWWEGLTQRDRRILMVGGALLCLLLPYMLIWQPLHDRAERLERTLVAQRADASWMQQAAAQLRATAATGRTATPAGQSLLGLIDRTVREGQLGGTVRRVQPEGANTVRVWLEDAPFDELMIWLGTLETRHGIRATSLVVDRQAAPGRVNARLTLEG
ncbi:type II secretion system protein GspM [Thioalkalivibrio sulfidiphilus]|uniref:type II secretion system protein GspM n=1 Tax=Thioalkalivibrio sulfidiphilus TaxID=1033854 RepID=UPI00037E9118|nr:type II secretion system protein M [Thioalkalivibrio sulfidiphilus]